MKYHIAILAGGLGSRLNKTEPMPKPLVDINGISLISRIIYSLNKTGLFKCFHILTCCDNGLYKEILEKEVKSIKFIIYNEINRTGRVGAIENFLSSQDSIDNFFVCNGDTIFLKIKSSEIITPVRNFNFKPIIYLAMPDPSRNDYKSIRIKKNSPENQNSGLFFISRSWFNKYNKVYPDLKDIDDLLFLSEESSNLYILSTSLLDAGTPERLSNIRRLVK